MTDREYRKHLIETGAVKPLSARPTLRLDEAGQLAAAMHIVLYRNHPELYVDTTFTAEPPPDYVLEMWGDRS